MYNNKNKSFSSKFYIQHLQVQCVTCPSYKVHLYFLIDRVATQRWEIKENTVEMTTVIEKKQ